MSEQKQSSETPVPLSALTLPSQPQASELTAGRPHARGPIAVGRIERPGHTRALLGVVGQIRTPKLSNPSPQKCYCATLHGKRDFTDMLHKNVKTGLSPGVSSGPGEIAKAPGRGRQQARVRAVTTEAEVCAGFSQEKKGP